MGYQENIMVSPENKIIEFFLDPNISKLLHEYNYVEYGMEIHTGSSILLYSNLFNITFRLRKHSSTLSTCPFSSLINLISQGFFVQ